MIVIKGVGVGLRKDDIQTIPERMIETVVDVDQVSEPMQIEIELDAINEGNMIIVLRIVQL